MNRPELYQKSVNTLLDAYNNHELTHGDCERCAVGNLLGGRDEWSYAVGYTALAKDGTQYGRFARPIVIKLTNGLGGSTRLDTCHSIGEKIIEESGYTRNEIIDIEYAFESSLPLDPSERKAYTRGTLQKRGQFIGLCAVLDKLQEIHSAEIEQHEENVTKLEAIYEQFV